MSETKPVEVDTAEIRRIAIEARDLRHNASIDGQEVIGPVAQRRFIALCDALDARGVEIERLRTGLSGAIEEVSEWGAYASEYFQEKWSLKQRIEDLKSVLSDNQ